MLIIHLFIFSLPNFNALIVIFMLLVGKLSFGQNAKNKEEKDKRPTKISLLSNYYDQDGDRSAVNGGLGSQKLESFSQEVHLYLPIKSVDAVAIDTGIDHFTSASLATIDKYVSAASSGNTGVSGDETRIYGNVAYEHQLSPTVTVAPRAGFSSEYDVQSVNAGLSLSKKLKKNDQVLSTSFGATVDRWMVVHPGEFRASALDAETGASASSVNPYATPFVYSGEAIEKDGQMYPVDYRTSYALVNGFSFAINQKMNASVGLDLLAQKGLLSTPFHRVYFNDGIGDEYQKEVRIEKLPRERYKIAISGRFNYFLDPAIVLRTYARLYKDTWDINSITFGMETVLKVNKSFAITPFARFHYQEGTSYYAAYGQHVYNPEEFYTSDMDLATFSAVRTGLALRYVPFANAKLDANGKPIQHFVAMKDIGLRYAHNNRQDGLTGSSLSFEITFEL
ncbi:DUF3570 domain-containing protein [Flavobacterium sp. ZT3R18]|nr:DUF3570 domain-containing protein [Flavobacterium sp. ZT3R18]